MIAYGLPGVLLLVFLTLVWILASWGLAVAICNTLFNRNDRHGPLQLTVRVREIELDGGTRGSPLEYEPGGVTIQEIEL